MFPLLRELQVMPEHSNACGPTSGRCRFITPLSLQCVRRAQVKWLYGTRLHLPVTLERQPIRRWPWTRARRSSS